MTTATIIADSVFHGGSRLTTFYLKYPRIIHAEVLTHRAFSRNSSSSRAIPISKMLAEVKQNGFTPNIWIAAHAGMAGSQLVKDTYNLKRLWDKAKNHAVSCAMLMNEAGGSKQVINRLIEPFSYIDVILTAEHNQKGLGNFFELRAPKYPEGWEHQAHTPSENFLNSSSTAQWEIQELAQAMQDAIALSTPIEKDEQQGVHVPFNNNQEFYSEANIAISVVKCARVSFGNALKEIDALEALEKYENLKANKHASPFEHICFQSPVAPIGNFDDWQQLRHIIGL
jgi:thymidylate synthase ThyX